MLYIRERTTASPTDFSSHVSYYSTNRRIRTTTDVHSILLLRQCSCALHAHGTNHTWRPWLSILSIFIPSHGVVPTVAVCSLVPSPTIPAMSFVL